MSDIQHRFLKESEKKAFDYKHRATIRFNMARYEVALATGRRQYANLEMAKQRAAYIKNKSIYDLYNYLLNFEAAFEARGGKVIWAPDANTALSEILKIVKKQSAKLVVKSKSMVSEEIELNHYLAKHGVTSVETDLGEFIVQEANERPYHIVTPAMHKSKEDIAGLYHKKFGLPEHATPEQITAFTRKYLRAKFQEAGVGITGANFLIADIGAVSITENEGNAALSVSFPKTHIVVAGIEKVIPSLTHLDLFLPLLATHGTGQKISTYNNIVSGPRQEGEIDGPDEMYVVLLDNNRSDILFQIKNRSALTCIRCGACLNVCPVYKNIGGHTYGKAYSGPIGAVITPWLSGMKDYKHLSYASSLCGACTEVCPVKINLHEQLLYNRNHVVKEKQVARGERFLMKVYAKTMKSRKLLNGLSGKTKNKLLHRFVAARWGAYRNLPQFAEKSFNQLWSEQNPAT